MQIKQHISKYHMGHRRNHKGHLNISNNQNEKATYHNDKKA